MTCAAQCHMSRTRTILGHKTIYVYTLHIMLFKDIT